ncbi:unnamed protein product [Tenebrio molitor]|nr:unnamed protein product [Tenebrio molitor]
MLKHKLESLPDIPKSFYSVDKWPACRDSFRKNNVDEGSCDASWAIIPASMLSDRLCIESNGSRTNRLSAEDLLACCSECATQQNGCGEGVVQKVFQFWMGQGIVSEGCMPYSKSSLVNQKSSDCELRCTNPKFRTNSYKRDKHFGSLSYRLPNDELQILVEMIKHGPVVAEMTVYEDLLYYSNGIYEHVVGEKIGTDLVKIIGWDSEHSVTAETNYEEPVKYWRVETSWDDEWASNGFKIVRGDQHTKPRRFADVTTLRTSHKRPTMAKRILRGKLEASCPWTNAWRVKINPIKSNSILMMSPPQLPSRQTQPQRASDPQEPPNQIFKSQNCKN